ncbi:unnamed protein product [Effrenium voratum]|uniref:AMP-dependent synthetase/ligase domain-containing protein n=1 Tax=Effrenium voratum TaxID=2562239 RepID=A0AA36HQ19_9DINO|nr:unnamed protein product [Effrenium voratum]CAJ1373167.1 unnamed protein product [Effrenium voratum]CAJ1429413.1 unnamed protein product [Effrenium voratum]CAJ1454703.1 unnamed protein product [Effrenium voratum]|mmetsp:Transcript_113808/g.270988  ORF Transcript_113808/g.270988 Transcript_113808/m.270988 type:complete len:747 (+) Transcript_113808:88-2328(+)|eukprot:CAMPEP_0181426910 /NCGR_PEP_ID=MMETSP1110-20121109/15901_1 /TAXON_ID=174948 /ORGANISM="Symbiodinium sp., Strain CCMP421" /LENGTH=746 /DNA_ID=CAMNT_0023550109 /DNA_START=78 /DNA_END=2318 /DNA_ORIENTATION=-
MSAALKVALHFGGLLLVILDFLLWVITLGPIWMLLKSMSTVAEFARPAKKAKINGSLPASDVWQAIEALDNGKLTSSPFPDEGVQTVTEILERSMKRYAKKQAQGTRPLLSWKKDEGYRFPAKVFGPTQWRSYEEFGRLCKEFGAGLRAMGFQPQPEGDFDSLSGKFKILMYEETCADWQVCAYGAMTQNLVVATAYATLGTDAVVHAVNEGAVSALICNRKAAEGLMKIASQMPSLEAIIYLDYLCTPEECQTKLPGGGKVKLLSLQDVLDLGKAKPVPPSPPKPDSVAVLMYTSGSTGPPKGVVLRHKQLVAFVGACFIQFGGLIKDEGGETFLGYLPLAHILAVVAELFFYSTGNRIGYADPKSLLPGPEKCYPSGGLEEFQPTLMAGVPKVWETIKKGAELKVEKSGAVVSFLFKLAMRVKKAAVRQNRYTPLFDLLVFKKFKSMLGGCMKFTLSGGGAISPEVQEWVRAAFGCPLVQGYGLTETCGGAVLQKPLDDSSVGFVGSPMASIELTLHSEPELTDMDGKPYLATDQVHVDGSSCCGRGEIWMKGLSIASGYYKLPDKTAEDFDKDGWFHSGDIGLITPEGRVKIIDRKKNLVKLKGGEYVALELINVTYNNSSIINADAGGVCSFASSEIDRPVILAQCKKKELLELAAEKGVTGKDGEELCRDPKVMAAVKAVLDPIAKEHKLPALMQAIAVMPVLEPWTAENGCLTATSKLVPKQIYKAHAKDLDILMPMAMK